MTPLRFRSATADDAEAVASLHADSWQRHYRGAYADSFLDSDLVDERRSVWSVRLAPTVGRADGPGTATVLAEHGDQLMGFVHVEFDADPEWGSLVDNLHVRHDQRRAGIGSRLLAHAAQAVLRLASSDAMHLWVLEQNIAAQRFYLAVGGRQVETAAVPPPGGDPTRLNGAPRCLRMAWPDAAQL